MRLLSNNQTGTLGTTLAASTPGTSQAVTGLFAVAPGFATTTGSDYIPLVLEPGSNGTPSANFEIAHLTAYIAGSLNGTIIRGAEGTSAPAHSSGVVWAVATTVNDLPSQAQNAGALLSAYTHFR